ncbi:MAG: limonene-1,2-epoxide hydrolase family protein [Pseudomonadales bacterium]
MSNKNVIREFVSAWSRLNSDELASFFTDDGVYHNMPAGPVAGREEVREFIKGFTAGWTATTWELITIVEEGDVVVTERVDHIDMGDKHVDLPCLGIFEMEGNKIRVWRDYFDLGTYMKALV